MCPSSQKGLFSGLTSPLRIKLLWNQISALKLKGADNAQAGVVKCTELLGLLTDASRSPDRGEAYTARAEFYSALRQYDQNVDDRANAVVFYRQKKDSHQVELCEKWLRIAANFKKFAGFNPADPKAKLWYALPMPSNIWDFKSYSEARILELFSYLCHPEPDLRSRANELIASLPFDREPRLTEWLISFYRDHLEGEARYAGLRALRQLGRMMHMGLTDTVPLEVSLLRFGVASAFVCSTCAFCGWPNTGIPVPPTGAMLPYYSQKNDLGAYAVPAICDRCGSEFFLVWDSSPE
jgi:hypothetical protein